MSAGNPVLSSERNGELVLAPSLQIGRRRFPFRILALSPSYPHAAFPFSGIFNERCVVALSKQCNHIEMVAPRPYVPAFLAFKPRWKIYAGILGYERRNGIGVHRPPMLLIPGVGAGFWSDVGVFHLSRHYAKKLHRKIQFDVILSFDLSEVGGFAWRLGKYLGIPACGWAFGDDVRVAPSSMLGKSVRQAIQNLDVIFYQSTELLAEAARLAGMAVEGMSPRKHVVLPHGIPEPSAPGPGARERVRKQWGIELDAIVVLSLGRLVRAKGVYELLGALTWAASSNPKIRCVMVGSVPAFDETELVKKIVAEDSLLRERIKIVPACNPEEIWELFAGADIFAFASHREGMPNSLLEAMSVGLPAVAFAIPAVREIDSDSGAILKVPPFKPDLFARAILELSASPEKGRIMGEIAKRRVKEHFNIDSNMTRALWQIQDVLYKAKGSSWSYEP